MGFFSLWALPPAPKKMKKLLWACHICTSCSRACAQGPAWGLPSAGCVEPAPPGDAGHIVDLQAGVHRVRVLGLSALPLDVLLDVFPAPGRPCQTLSTLLPKLARLKAVLTWLYRLLCTGQECQVVHFFQEKSLCYAEALTA